MSRPADGTRTRAKTPVPDDVRRRLIAIIDRLGTARAAKELRSSHATVQEARSLSGVLEPLTLARITNEIDRVEREGTK